MFFYLVIIRIYVVYIMFQNTKFIQYLVLKQIHIHMKWVSCVLHETSSDGDLGSLEYYFIIITLRSTLRPEVLWPLGFHLCNES